MTDCEANVIEPKEKISCRLTKQELKSVHKKQLMIRIRSLIIYAVFIAVNIVLRFTSDVPDLLFGIALGVISLLILLTAVPLIDFFKKARIAVSNVEKREYVYSVFDDELKIEVFDGDDLIASEKRQYSDIQAIEEYKGLWLIMIMGRIFIIRKPDMTENSALYWKLQGVMSRSKSRKTLRRVVLIACAAMIAMGIIGAGYSKYRNDKAVSEIKSVISETYDEFEFLTQFFAYRDGKFVDNLILVESQGKIDVLRYVGAGDGPATFKLYVGLTPETDNASYSLFSGDTVNIRIYEDKRDIPQSVFFNEPFKFNGKTMYFCMTSSGNASGKDETEMFGEKIHSAISKTYDEYKLLEYTNVYKNKDFLTIILIVESKGKVDVLELCSIDDEPATSEVFVGLTPEMNNVSVNFHGAVAANIRIFENKNDIPSTVSFTAPFTMNNKTMYLGITYA